MENMLLISFTTSVVIIALLILSPFLDRRYSARWKYFVWLIIAIRLLIPFRVEPKSAPVVVNTIPNTNIIIENKLDFQPQNQVFSPEVTNQFSISTYDLIAIVWLLGVLIFLSYHIIFYIIFIKKLKPYLVPYNMDNKIPVYKCEKIKMPMMIGFFNSIVLLPDLEYDKEELSVILKHEMTHYKRLDLWYKLLLVVVNALHFFNPFVYFMVKQANRDLEYSCDDLVILGMDSEYKKKYALTILKSISRGN